MTNTSCLLDHDQRQSQLQSQIAEALDRSEGRSFSLLQSLWVHRYGFETLPDFQQTESIHYQNESDLISDNECSEELISFSLEDDSQQDAELGQSKAEIGEFQKEDISESYGLEEIGVPLANDYSEVAEEVDDEKTASATLEATPPPVALNHFRRWLPSLNERERNAS